jgi:hypothetical protein
LHSKTFVLLLNTVSDIYNPSSDNHSQVIKKLLALKENDDAFISILTLYEFEYVGDDAKLRHKKNWLCLNKR